MLLGEIWKRPALSVETKSYLIGAFMKISSQSQKIPTMASEIVKECMRSHDTELVDAKDRKSAYQKAVALQPGMQLEADVLIESRRLIEWVLDPLFTLTGRWRQ